MKYDRSLHGWHYYFYKQFLPSTVKMQHRMQPYAEINLGSSVGECRKDAILIGKGNIPGEDLYLLPGKIGNYFIHQGYTLPRSFPSRLDYSAYSAEIKPRHGGRYTPKGVQAP